MSRERPILFSAPMVRALLDGRKTQTRRVMKPQPEPFMVEDKQCFGLDPKFGGGRKKLRTPLGVPGDRLWVRETWATMAVADAVVFKASPAADCVWEPPLRWRPSIFMPRWASRITLEVTEVRVERLQELQEGDAVREGCRPLFDATGEYFEDYVSGHRLLSARDSFASLWDSINGPDSWEANPWVWAISFKRVDAKERAA